MDVGRIRDLEQKIAEQAEWIQAAETWILDTKARLERLEAADPKQKRTGWKDEAA